MCAYIAVNKCFSGCLSYFFMKLAQRVQIQWRQAAMKGILDLFCVSANSFRNERNGKNRLTPR